MKTLKNYFYNLAYQITALIVPFVTTPYISRIFGADGIGKYAVSYAIAQYFTLVGLLGINTYGVRQIAYYRDDKKNLYKIFWNLNYMRFITMGVSIFLFVIYIVFFVRESERIIYIAQSGVLLSSFFDISWYFSGTEQFKFTAIRNILVKLLGMILVFIFVKEKEDVWLYSFILALSLLLGQLSMWRIAFRSIPLVRPDTKMIKMFLKETFRLWIPAIAINIYFLFTFNNILNILDTS